MGSMSSEGNFDWTHTVAERKIQEAMKVGEFDNMPGKGQPLDLEVNPFEPAHLRAVNRLLKNARALPEWLQLEKDIVRERALLVSTRDQSLRAVRAAKNAATAARIAHRFRDEHRERLRTLGTLVLKYNMTAPQGAQKETFAGPSVPRAMAALDADLAEAGAPPASPRHE